MPLLKAGRGLARTAAGFLIAALALASSRTSVRGQTWQDALDYTKLKARLGSATPTGAGGMISMVEAPNGSGGYFVDTTQAEFTAPTDPFGAALNLVDGTGNAGLGNSSHATNTV